MPQLAVQLCTGLCDMSFTCMEAMSLNGMKAKGWMSPCASIQISNTCTLASENINVSAMSMEFTLCCNGVSRPIFGMGAFRRAHQPDLL